MESTSSTSPGAYATEDSGSDAKTGRAIRLGSSVSPSLSLRSARPMRIRLGTSVSLDTQRIVCVRTGDGPAASLISTGSSPTPRTSGGTDDRAGTRRPTGTGARRPRSSPSWAPPHGRRERSGTRSKGDPRDRGDPFRKDRAPPCERPVPERSPGRHKLISRQRRTRLPRCALADFRKESEHRVFAGQPDYQDCGVGTGAHRHHGLRQSGFRSGADPGGTGAYGRRGRPGPHGVPPSGLRIRRSPGHRRRLRSGHPARGRHRGGGRLRGRQQRRQLQHHRGPGGPGDVRHRERRGPDLRPATRRGLPAARHPDRGDGPLDRRPDAAPAAAVRRRAAVARPERRSAAGRGAHLAVLGRAPDQPAPGGDRGPGGVSHPARRGDAADLADSAAGGRPRARDDAYGRRRQGGGGIRRRPRGEAVSDEGRHCRSRSGGPFHRGRAAGERARGTADRQGSDGDLRRARAAGGVAARRRLRDHLAGRGGPAALQRGDRRDR